MRIKSKFIFLCTKMLISAEESEYRPCPSETEILWNLDFICGKEEMHFSPEKSITDHFKKLRELQQRGGCKKFLTRMFLDRNSKDFQDNDLHQTPKKIDYENPPLHVLLAIDMDVTDEIYWSKLMPEALTRHLRSVTFPDGTTFELVLAGASNIYVHYPFIKQDFLTFREKRSTLQAEPCLIDSKEVLIERLKTSTNTIPPLSEQLYTFAGLNSHYGANFLNLYLYKFLPMHGQVLVLHVINHEVKMTADEIDAHRTLMETLAAERPKLDLFQHFMLIGPASSIADQLKILDFDQSRRFRWSTRIDSHQITKEILGEITGKRPNIIPDSGCSSNPCLNDCQCQPSCQDENDYVCVPPAGRPLVGKNCEWEAAVKCRADRSIFVSIPEAAVQQYANGMQNALVQGCNNPPSYECYDNPTCGPVKKADKGHYILECTENEFRNQNGQWTFGHTIVFDRDSEIHSMAHAIVKVECMMHTRKAHSIISPQIRPPNSVVHKIYWQPYFEFFKTAWGTPMIRANNGAEFTNGAVGYIIGERIHVRISASLNGVLAADLANNYKIAINTCTIGTGSKTGQILEIIRNGTPVDDELPVWVDHHPGNLGSSVEKENEGVGFSFQVFTFKSGSILSLICGVDITSKRDKRSSDDATEEIDSGLASAQLMLFSPTRIELNNNVQVLAMPQEFEEDFDDPLLEEVRTLHTLSTWLTILMVSGIVVLIFAGLLYYRRFHSGKELA